MSKNVLFPQRASDLVSMLMNPAETVPYVCVSGVTGILQSIERENGSGRSFNVRLNVNGTPRTVYVRF